MNIRLKDCFLVSCRQTISQLLFITRSLTTSHFLLELIPLTFQLRTDQVLVDIDKAKRLKEAKPYITRYQGQQLHCWSFVQRRKKLDLHLQAWRLVLKMRQPSWNFDLMKMQPVYCSQFVSCSLFFSSSQVWHSALLVKGLLG